jgi:hypothetical protein
MQGAQRVVLELPPSSCIFLYIALDLGGFRVSICPLVHGDVLDLCGFAWYTFLAGG